MAREKIRFQCEICGEEYDDLVDAINCESTHILIDENVDLRAKYSANKEFPSVIYVKFADGIERPYWNYDYEGC